MHFLHIRMRVRPFPLSARENRFFAKFKFGSRMMDTPVAGVVAGLIDNFQELFQSVEQPNGTIF
ncbi:MAG TPA: hypothetical protein DDW73_13660 [Rhizobium sp.]|nr:hypothetical protein [Rhizobium sp.]